MNRAEAAAAYAALFVPSLDDLRQVFGDLGHQIECQLDALCRAPSLDGCDQLLAYLEGVRRAAVMLKAQLSVDRSMTDEGGGDGQ